MAEPLRETSSVAHIPELLEQIFAFLPVSDCARLTTTSRSVFRIVAPRVWRDVLDVSHALSLIPGTEIVHCEFYSKLEIKLPPAPADFSRFSLYSAYVNTLTTTATPEKLIISPWRPLLVQASATPLFPNLISLHVNNSRMAQDDLIHCVYAFVPPTIKSISLGSLGMPPSPKMSLSAFSVILNHLKHTSPALEKLDIFPGLSTSPAGGDGRHPLVSKVWDEPFCHHLSGLSHLRHIVTDSGVLTPDGIHALGTLPHLQSIDLGPRLYRHTVQAFEGATLDSQSFPALRRLGIHFLSLLDIHTIWDSMEPMIARLNTLELELPFTGPGDPGIDAFVLNHFPLICRRSPDLSDLSICWGEPICAWISGESVLNMYARYSKSLPLKRVSIRQYIGASTGVRALGDPQTYWPEVVELIIPEYAGGLPDLARFAALPKLERLVVSLGRVHYWSFPPVEQVRAGSRALHTVELASEHFELPYGDNLRRLASHFLALWPNIRSVNWFEDDPGDLNNQFELERLNMHISELHP